MIEQKKNPTESFLSGSFLLKEHIAAVVVLCRFIKAEHPEKHASYATLRIYKIVSDRFDFMRYPLITQRTAYENAVIS